LVESHNKVELSEINPLAPITGTRPLVNPDAVKLVAAIALPAVRLATLTCFVLPDCTIGNTSVPARGVVDAGSAEIFESAIINP
jgi:hypothetical protein